ncbi:hypothetical protein Pr1d_25050 [Bythopirellula goksoeyrii]|uniref:Uncharacterized protein n=1 Tax=Bythopirellula goksoeyrii TaxID=1400387 RepID=A0A5B9QM23_9BACT|nr:hypothetical protein Pr1d_25050 [Bythopirellula goksoeyrii]
MELVEISAKISRNAQNSHLQIICTNIMQMQSDCNNGFEEFAENPPQLPEEISHESRAKRPYQDRLHFPQ